MFFGALGQLSIGQYNAPGTPTSVVLDPHVQPIGVFALGQGSLQNDASGYTLTANYTNFVLSGIAAPLVTTEIVNGGSYTYTGNTVVFNPAVVTASGGFVETGYTTVTAQVWSVNNGSLTASGQAVIFVPAALAQYVTFAQNGRDASFALAQIVSSGSVSLNGKSVIFATSHSGEAGYFTVTGGDALLYASASLGTFALSGQGATFAPALLPATGQFAFSGSLTTNVTFYVLGGTYTYSGQAVNVITLPGSAGTFTTTGFYARMLLSIIEQWTQETQPTGAWSKETVTGDPWSKITTPSGDGWDRIP